MIGWLRDWVQWFRARRINPTAGLIGCLHPNPPGFTKCKLKTAYCLTCGAAFKC